MRALVAALTLWSAVASAADRRIEQAVQAFANAEFARVRDTLALAVDDPALSPADSVLARTYLAASYHALSDIASARSQLTLLFREHPDARIDPSIFLPDLISLAEAARIEVAQKWPRKPEAPPESVTPPVATKGSGVSAAKWTAAGLTLAAFAGASIAGLLARGDDAELHARPHPTAQVEQLTQSGRAKATAANVLFGVAAVGGLACVTLFIVTGTF